MLTVAANTQISTTIEDKELLELLEQVDLGKERCSVNIVDDTGYGICLPGTIHHGTLLFYIPEPLCLLAPGQTYRLLAELRLSHNGQHVQVLDCPVQLEATERGQEGDEQQEVDTDLSEFLEASVKPPVRSVDHVPEDVLAEVVDLTVTEQKKEATKLAPVAPEQFIKVVEQELKEQRAKKTVAVVPSVPKTPLSPTAQSIKTKMKQVLKAALK